LRNGDNVIDIFMPNLNKVQLMGNLTRDPELKFTPKGTAICDLGLAINRTWKDDSDQKQEETTFIDVTFWGKSGEVIEKYVKKGQPIYIEGRLQLDTWEDKTTGQNRSKLKVTGESFQFLPNGKKEDREQPPAGSHANADAVAAGTPSEGGDDIPFAQFEEHSPLPI
jgi:single-strand DNA-binding protein